MKITQVSYERLHLKLATPYVIAYETVAQTTNFIIKIETNKGLVGYGCAAPDQMVTGETASEVEAHIKTILMPYLIGKNPYMLSKILEELKLVFKVRSSTLAMVDMALLDLVSRKMAVPLYHYLGGYRHSIATSITIGIVSLEDTLKQAREYIKQGFFILKIKGGLSLESDIEKMVRLREMFTDVRIRFDGNQGYSVEEAISFFAATNAIGVEIFEQPTKMGRDEKLGQVKQEIEIPLMADESLKTLKDVFRLAHNKHIDMVNIKLMKVGGIMEGMHINSVAKAANLEAMIGCIDECRLGISAGLHFALSRPNIKYADLDGHLDIENDPFKGLFKLKKGILYPTDSPGLGKIEGFMR
jgi:L-alanine-DL-glutamate epimerase-like enolase superfamily enzyme